MVEKRRFVRVDARLFTHCKVKDNNGQNFDTTSKNISENGIRLQISENAVGVGTILQLEINVPFDTLPILAKGRVVWIGKEPDGFEPKVEVGVEIIEIHQYHAQRLQNYIDERIREQKSICELEEVTA